MVRQFADAMGQSRCRDRGVSRPAGGQGAHMAAAGQRAEPVPAQASPPPVHLGVVALDGLRVGQERAAEICGQAGEAVPLPPPAAAGTMTRRVPAVIVNGSNLR